MNNQKRKNGRSSIVTRLVILFCVCCFILFVVLVGWFVFELPKVTTERFGPPAAGISASQRMYLTIQLFMVEGELTTPVQLANSIKDFHIDLGESIGSISNRLQTAGIIKSGDALRTYLIYSGKDQAIQAGDYQLNPAKNTVEIANQLLDATPEEVTFNILAGMRAEEVAALLPTSGLSIDSQQFIAAVRVANPYANSEIDLSNGLEGYLFPSSYRLKREIGLNDFLQTFTNRFVENISPEMRAGFANNGLNIYQAVILASIVQREAMVEDEQPLIASVFLNRLAKNMRLESDPTVQYALGWNNEKKTWWTNPLSLGNLKFDSPYNTYINNGLPPGPISNPGLAALKAVANPAQSDFLYFRAQCDGSGRHAFSTTYEEHLQNACP